MACGVSNSPGAVPFFPHAVMSLPALENLTTRALESPPWPSATKMSPLRAMATPVGRLKKPGASPGIPAWPSVINTLPVGLNLTTTWPLPFLPSASATHTFPSWSTVIPCGKTNMPAPKLASSLPDGSKCRIGDRFELEQVSPPQRSKTQTLLPSRSIATAVVPPHARPAGSWPNDVAAPNGSGRSMLGWVASCARAAPVVAPATAMAAAKAIAVNLARRISVPCSSVMSIADCDRL